MSAGEALDRLQALLDRRNKLARDIGRERLALQAAERRMQMLGTEFYRTLREVEEFSVSCSKIAEHGRAFLRV